METGTTSWTMTTGGLLDHAELRLCRPPSRRGRRWELTRRCPRQPTSPATAARIAEPRRGRRARPGFWALALGSVGVVFGDIGTSPLYAMREALHPRPGAAASTRADVLGVISLVFWALILIVTSSTSCS